MSHTVNSELIERTREMAEQLGVDLNVDNIDWILLYNDFSRKLKNGSKHYQSAVNNIPHGYDGEGNYVGGFRHNG